MDKKQFREEYQKLYKADDRTQLKANDLVYKAMEALGVKSLDITHMKVFATRMTIEKTVRHEQLLILGLCQMNQAGEKLVLAASEKAGSAYYLDCLPVKDTLHIAEAIMKLVETKEKEELTHG